MTEQAAAAHCRLVCGDLLAGRQPGAVGADDERTLRHLLRVQGLSGLAARAIEEGSLLVSRPTAEAISRDWADAMAWSATLDEECVRVGGAALGQGSGPSLSQPILLKGPAVARRYSDPTLRPYTDIDLLVPVDDVDSWAGVLVELGFWAPAPDVAIARRRYKESVSFLKVGSEEIAFDVHTCVFIERRARDFGYGAVAEDAQESRFPGLLEPSVGAHLVVLALHLVHHPVGTWRLMWLRDFIELGSTEAVAAARDMAAAHGVSWALERALRAAEGVLGHPMWNARPPDPEPFGLAGVHQLERTGYLRHVALVRELGPVAGMRYLASRVDPRRFAPPGGGFSAAAARSWTSVAVKRILATPWAQGLVRGSRHGHSSAPGAARHHR